MEYVIEMLNITKRFGNFTANNDITLQIKKGEIHALLGENGAGKSTLMNILFGLYEQDEGTIKINGQEQFINSPNKASELGIGMVHQHFMLVDKFTVTENIILGSERTRYGLLNIKEAAEVIANISNKYHLKVDPFAKISTISVGMQQRVEILKMLYRGAQILILDEPTANLTPQEIVELIKIMRRLADEGKSLILITHKLKEIMSVCDRVTVIRRGNRVATLNVKDVTPNRLASLMVGREISFKQEKQRTDYGQEVLKIKNLFVKDSNNVEKINDLHLSVAEGEIVGIAGVDGNGQSELIDVIAGLKKATRGSIKINGKEATNENPRKIIEHGLGHIPEDRHKHGLVLDFSVAENVVLQTYYKQPFSKYGVLNKKNIFEKGRQIVSEYDVRLDNELQLARTLSGGNQQKLIIGREVDRNPDLLIAAQPTRGLDVGAIEFVHQRLLEQRNHGKAILLISFELDEILNLSDRIAVIFEGQIIDIVNPNIVTEQQLGLLMAGHRLERSGD